MPLSVAVDILLCAHRREVDERSTVGVYKLGGVATTSRASQNVGLEKSKGIGLQYVDICWFCTDDEIIVDMAASISQPALAAATGRLRVAPSTPIIFDVQLLYIPNVSFSIGE